MNKHSNSVHSYTYNSSTKFNQISTTESESHISSFKRVYLEWYNITFFPYFDPIKQIRILNSVSGFANPGEMVAIMGSSGAGKTTLLNILCHRQKFTSKSKYEGTITANGIKTTDINYRDFIGYVTQEDLMMPTMTCRETFEFAGVLKINAPKDHVRNCVQEMLNHLHLETVSESIIGTQTLKGISGGERKRVAIGVELLSEPSVLFLDEPTSGLDSFTADIIVDLLILEAKRGRNVISTIHQPSRLIFDKFHRTILMCEGNFVYQGFTKEAAGYLLGMGFTVPKFINPPDYYMNLLHIRDRSHKTPEEIQRLELFLTRYKENLPHFYSIQSISYLENTHLEPILKSETVRRTSWYIQFRENLKRSNRNVLRNPMLYRVGIIQTIWMILISDALWNNLGNDIKGVQSMIGFLFSIMLQQMFQSCSSMAMTCNFNLVPTEKYIYYKEKSSGFYSLSSYFLAKNISTIYIQIIQPVIVSLAIYWVVGLNNQPNKFFIFSKFYAALILILSNMIGGSVGLLAGAVFPSPRVAMPAAPTFLSIFMLYAGFLSNGSSKTERLDWLRYISVKVT